MKSQTITIVFLLIIVLVFLTCDNVTEPKDNEKTEYDRVVFSEIYLDSTNQLKNWIELYNPTDKDIQITSGRLSHVRCINCLPQFLVRSQDYLVICANDSVFLHYQGYIGNIFEIPILSHFTIGGFFVIRTEKDTTKIIEAFRYGIPEYTSSLEWLSGSDPVPFSTDDSSYTAEIIGKNEFVNLYKFHKCKPTPGFTND